MNINLHIERLMVDGPLAADAIQGIGSKVQAELKRSLGEGSIRPEWRHGIALARADAAPIAAVATQADLGRQIAVRIHRLLAG
jgi:hypothetical protein